MGRVGLAMALVVIAGCTSPTTNASPAPSSAPAAVATSAPSGPASPAAPPAPLRGRALLERVGARGFPHATLFRTIESLVRRNMPIADVVPIAQNYDLILMKALDEEIIGNQKVAPYLQAIKARYADKIVLDHFLWNGRHPLSTQPEVFPGHWLLLSGTPLTANAAAGDAVLQVGDSGALRAGEAAQITALDASGKPDWSKVEQIKVTSVAAGRATVERGAYGSTAIAFSARSARVAAHANIPYSDPPVWLYNYCLEAPRDGQGRRFIEALADTLAGYLKPGAILAGLDGYQFDVAAFTTGSFLQGARRIDCDNDGAPDAGYLNGVSSYGLGAASFFSGLRSRLGDDVILISETTGGRGERSLPYANGIENESFPDFHSWDHFASAFQKYRYWVENARAPRISYLQLKETSEAFSGCPDQDRGRNWTYRLALAASLMADGYFALMPLNEADRKCDYNDPKYKVSFAEPDEFMAGRDNKFGYLGKPVEDARRVGAAGGPSLLPGGDFEGGLAGATVATLGSSRATVVQDTANPAQGKASLKASVTALDPDPDDAKVRVTFTRFPVQKGKEYAIRFKVRAETVYGKIDPLYAGLPRRVPFDVLVAGKQTPTPTNIQPLMEVIADGTWRDYVLSFVAAADDAGATLRMSLGNEPGDVWLDDLSVTEGGADVFARRFENGVVLMNASSSPFAFDLGKLFPGTSLRRIDGVVDKVVNDGQAVGPTVTVPARDALILLSRTP
jgi:hypothetical protein